MKGIEPRGGRKVILAVPRGFCSGVRQAVALAERLLKQRSDKGLYVLGELVHNPEVVDTLRRRGAIPIQTLDEAPSGATVLFSAHGVAPAVRQAALRRGLQVADATCPFVRRLHELVTRYAKEGHHVVLIGRHGHEEVEGIAGEAPGQVTVLQTEAEAQSFAPPPGARIAIVVQTTLSEYDVAPVLKVLRKRFASLRFPPRTTVCHATRARQEAVQRLARVAPFILVLGAENSSNSRRLVEVAQASGARAVLIPSDMALQALDLKDEEVVGLTAGASTPDSAIQRALSWLRSQGFDPVEEIGPECDPVPSR